MNKLNQNVETEQNILNNASDLINRTLLQSIRPGSTFNGNRKLSEIFGYKEKPTYKDYYATYKRVNISKRIIELLPDAAFNNSPEIKASSSFTTLQETLFKKLSVYSYLRRSVILSRIGQYSILLLGVDDGLPLEQPLLRATKLIYLRPYSQQATNIILEGNSSNPRYGQPLYYELSLNNTISVKVHYSRVIHIAEGLLEDDNYGIPTLEPIFDVITDLLKITGSSCEAFYMNINPTKAIMLDDTTPNNPTELEDVSNQLQELDYGLRKWLRLKAQDLKVFPSTISSPKMHFDMLISLISGTIGIPKRILIGSERAHLSSSQDEKNFLETCERYARIYIAPNVIRPFIEKLQQVGILPQEEFEVIFNFEEDTILEEKEEIGASTQNTGNVEKGVKE